MSLFLTRDELQIIRKSNRDPSFSNLYWALLNRAQHHASKPGLRDENTTTDWWHHAYEYLSETALAYVIKPDATQGAWLREVTMGIARRPEDDWIGPAFRIRQTPPEGHLETAHLSMAVALVLDLAPDVFTEAERAELVDVLKTRAIPLCRNWIAANRHLANWRCILLAGATVAAAVSDDPETLAWARREYTLCLDVVQPDGSYGESLQYASYCFFGLMMTREALARSAPEKAEDLPIASYAKAALWFVYSHLYRKPVEGFCGAPMPRSINFNDSAAIGGPMPDLLLHIAAHAPPELAREAGLARWLFDQLYVDDPARGPSDRASFGFVNRPGILSVIYYPRAPEAVSPSMADLPLLQRFSNGHQIARSGWTEDATVLAVSGAPDPLHGPGHLHADLNSLILVHNRERLLVDPGHSCYRNLIHELECATKTHNTCTFEEPPGSGLQEQLKQSAPIQQTARFLRKLDTEGRALPPVIRPGKPLLCAGIDDLRVMGSDVAESYGSPIRMFRRFCILAGDHVVFVVDTVESERPVRTIWNWLLNNRDGRLELKPFADRLVARRGNAGLKLFHLGDGVMSGPFYGFVHDAYHTLPAESGEGRSGSGMHIRWTGKTTSQGVTVHAMAVDTYGRVAGWHLQRTSALDVALENPDGNVRWALTVDADGAMRLSETVSGRGYRIEPNEGVGGVWELRSV